MDIDWCIVILRKEYKIHNTSVLIEIINGFTHNFLVRGSKYVKLTWMKRKT